MPKIKNCIYVVTLTHKGEKLYFVRQEGKPFYIEGEVLNQPLGIFSPDLSMAKKFMDQQSAWHCASYFDNGGVECIHSGERLK